MSSLTLEQAARASGRSAREIRLLLEEGRLRGAVRAGRWQVEPAEVDGLVDAFRDPAEPRLREVPAPAPRPEPVATGSDPVATPRPTAERPTAERAVGDGAAAEELVSRLEQRAIEIARLRGELEALREGRDEHGARLERELSGLRRELADARERIAELESEEAEEAGSPRRPGMSEALTPLFRPTHER